MAQSLGIGETYARQIDGAAAGQIARERDQKSRHVAIGAVMNQHNDGISLIEDGVADNQHPDTATAQ